MGFILYTRNKRLFTNLHETRLECFEGNEMMNIFKLTQNQRRSVFDFELCK